MNQNQRTPETGTADSVSPNIPRLIKTLKNNVFLSLILNLIYIIKFMFKSLREPNENNQNQLTESKTSSIDLSEEDVYLFKI